MQTPYDTQLPIFDNFSTEEMANYMKTLRGPYSQTELALLLQTNPSVVNNWEQGVSRPSPRYLRAAIEHYRNWAIQLQLPTAAQQAMRAAGIKKSLTTKMPTVTTA